MKTPRMSHLRPVYVLAAAVVAVSAGLAGGAIIPLADSGWSAVVGPDTDITVTVDSVRPDAVVIKIEKTFGGEPDEFGLMPPMYLEFIKDSPDALNKIIINDEFVTNDTALPWIDFHMVLPVSIFEPQAGFCTCSDPDGDQFETVLLSGSNGYAGLPTRIDFFDGLVPNNPPEQDDFAPGLESGEIIIVIDPDLPVGDRILLKEYPTIPEPATMGFLAISGLTLALLRRRK